MKKQNKLTKVLRLGILGGIVFPTIIFAPSAVSSMAVVSQVDLAELQELRTEVKYLRSELRNEATAARAAREEAKRYFEALVKLSK